MVVDSAHPHSGDGGIEKRGKLVFVDLAGCPTHLFSYCCQKHLHSFLHAGSERLKRSNSESPEETGAINKSLFNLAKVWIVRA